MFPRIAFQRAIAEAYRTNPLHVDGAMSKLESMIETLELLEPKTQEDLIVGAHAVIEEFAIGIKSSAS